MARKVQEAKIYKDAQELYKAIYEGQFEMCQRDRPSMAVDLLKETREVIKYFALSYKVNDLERKRHYGELSMGSFEVLKTLIRMAIEENMFKTETTKSRLIDMVVVIDEGMEKWNNKLVLNEAK